ncbi:MAG TPA: hypothetical protein VHE30_25120 [Polyangiaceae bacterium]|nr:hypothetical protein [Polyangiaceae bacterium]
MRRLALPLLLLRVLALVLALGVAHRSLPEIPGGPACPRVARSTGVEARIRDAQPPPVAAIRVAPPARAEKLPVPLFGVRGAVRRPPFRHRDPSPELAAVWTGRVAISFLKRVPRMGEPPRSVGRLSIA